LKLITFSPYEEEKIFIVLYEFLDYVPLGTYLRLISWKNWTFESYKSIIIQLIDAISYCQEHFVIHGDLNLSNVLICPIEKKAKIIDFGSAKLISESNNLYSPIGNPKYRPPSEGFLSDVAFTGDCWSLGLILMSLVLKERVTTKIAINFFKIVFGIELKNWEQIKL